ncbi:MAG: hypothetical protein LBL49_07160 [Clostridiales Family XIII bacterium]|jgi:hypothetical protein|nr:hypothetical protein [Clostridiales Family XIII bacterium]
MRKEISSFYKFDFNGNFSESIDDDHYFYMEPQEYPKGSNVFYYLLNEKASPSKKLMRLDYNTFQEEVLLDFSGEAIDEYVDFYIDEHSVYYLNYTDHSIWQMTFDNGTKTKLFAGAENLISDYDNGAFYFLSKEGVFCIYDVSSGKINEIGRFGNEIVSKAKFFGKWLNRRCLYYTHDADGVIVQYVYDIDTNENHIIAESVKSNYAAFSKPAFMGDLVGILSYPRNTIYIWDSEENKLAERLIIEHDKIDLFVGAYEDRYFLYSVGDTLLGIIDMITRTDYIIDIAALIEQTGGAIDYWFLEGNYLYAQDVCDWSVSVDSPDEFYRIDITAIVSK